MSDPMSVGWSLLPGDAHININDDKISKEIPDTRVNIGAFTTKDNMLTLTSYLNSNMIAAKINLASGQVFGRDGKAVHDTEGKEVFLTEKDIMFLIQKGKDVNKIANDYSRPGDIENLLSLK
ncbi:MAG: hypothetical protein PHV30_05640 [Candidatus Margulisbacteria bacterium]|nr:hypothetical protein [Candidatus Margulisiibacteriota bacterium]